MRHLMTFGVAILTLSGCGAAPAEVTQYHQLQVDSATRRASFDLECPAESLEVECLDRAGEAGDSTCTTAGVRGCGRRATYVLQLLPMGNRYHEVWTLDHLSESSPDRAEPPDGISPR